MKLSRLCLLSLLPLASASAASVPKGWFVWPVVEPAKGSALDCSSLNATAAGALGRIYVKEGRFVTPDGRPLRFWGVNLSSNSAFPSEADAELLAARLAKAGVNIARLHHLDNPWGVKDGGSIWPKDSGRHQELDVVQLDKLHRLIAILARHGIYTNLNLKVSKSLVEADGFPKSVEKLPDFQKRVDLFDRKMIELQKDYARRILTTKNPYTGKSPAEDPAVAIIEINNENSVFGYFTRDLGRGAEAFPEPFKGDLVKKWNDWLAKRYGDTATLAKAWDEPLDPNGAGLLDANSSTWIMKRQPGSEAELTPGKDGSAFSVKVSQTQGADWHVQISTHGLKVEDNKVYTLSCLARAASPSRLGLGLSNDDKSRPGEAWRSLGLLQSVEVGVEWTPIQIAFPVHSTAGNTAMLSFNTAAQTGAFEFKDIRLTPGAANGGVRPGQSLEAGAIPLPTEPTTRQWGDWLAFLAAIDRGFADEMRGFLRNELQVQAPLLCSQVNFTGMPALHREQEMEVADTHMYWQHPDFPASGWDPANWTITNSPMISVYSDRRFGGLGDLAMLRVAGKPFSVSEYDHAAPSDFVSEMYPEFAIVGCRQDWDALYAFDLGDYGSRNPDGRITGYFDQINHPAKWSLAPFASRVFREALVPAATQVAELRPGTPVWGEAMHADLLWDKLSPDTPLDFLNCRLQVSDLSRKGPAELIRSGTVGAQPARVIEAPQGKVLLTTVPQASVATGHLGGASVDTGTFKATCARFGRDFGTIAAVSLDGKPISSSSRVLVTLVARAENQGMKWNEARTSVGTNWGHGPTIAEQMPATLEFRLEGDREVYALKPDGTRARRIKTEYKSGTLSFSVSAKDKTLHYEIITR